MHHDQELTVPGAAEEAGEEDGLAIGLDSGEEVEKAARHSHFLQATLCICGDTGKTLIVLAVKHHDAKLSLTCTCSCLNKHGIPHM